LQKNARMTENNTFLQISICQWYQKTHVFMLFQKFLKWAQYNVPKKSSQQKNIVKGAKYEKAQNSLSFFAYNGFRQLFFSPFQ
jgi:hypothetical protein